MIRTYYNYTIAVAPLANGKFTAKVTSKVDPRFMRITKQFETEDGALFGGKMEADKHQSATADAIIASMRRR